MEHWYLHADLDAFFASVEQLDNPELRGKPVIVGGKPEDRRSVVSTASYEARAFGVHSAMPVFQAYRLCPQGIFVHGRMQRYAELSYQIMNIFRDYSPDVDQMSIDEAFIDLTGTEKLFGPPEKVALEIKKRVKEETGLTISVGLATTKYLAKISSGLSKPDGFYHLKAGNEQNFMLNLPLTKVWGLGPKSLELIRSKGLHSTRDIYERSYDTLEFLFGKNMATFLYNVVRGGEKESFERERKSHSISAETTFPYDLTDIYTIETELLELAHGVYFRLLKKEGYSRTAFIKIRYDDFSTCTVQETVDRNIMTLDSFFEIIKRLFEKRYENGRGIRLLGVGFENITKEDKPYQQDLFSTGSEEKKQAVEKAILNLSKKHPEIKVRKARTLKAVLAVIVMSSLSVKGVAAEEKPAEIPVKDPPVIFDFDINDKNHVDLSLSGYWHGMLTENLDLTFGNGTRTGFSWGIPVFKQDVELSASLWLNHHWYFEADFADAFMKNTIAAGYEGDGLIRKARVANRGITMSEGYSASLFGFGLEGGNNQAPGFLLQLKPPSERWQADFLLRYDMTEVKSATWYGMNSVTDVKLDVSNFMYGREFRFPDRTEGFLQNISAVYVQDSSGKFTDTKGRKFRKLSSEEYSIRNENKRLFISANAGAVKGTTVLLTFFSPASVNGIISAEGSWSDSASFLGQIQNELGCNGKYNVSKFSYNQITKLNGEEALVIQNSTGFSPFLCPTTYDLGTSVNKEEFDVSLISRNSEQTFARFNAVTTDESYTSLYLDYFNDRHSYIQVSDQDNPQSPYPFACIAPEIYLGLTTASDICILSRTFCPQKELRISKDAAGGTVLVYKNGIVMHGTSYNPNTGVVTLSEGISNSDKIVITWQEDTKDFSKGSITAGAGIKYNFLPGLSGDLSLTGRWPVSFNTTFAANGNNSIKNGFAALTAGIEWTGDDFSIKEKTSLSVQKDNTSEGLIVLTQGNGIPYTYYHDASAAAGAVSDIGISGYCIPLKWTSVNEAQNVEASVDIKLTAGSLIMNSDTLEVAVKPDFKINAFTPAEGINLNSHLDVILVCGIKAGETPQLENLDEYPHWKLNGVSNFDLTKNNWQTIILKIEDSDRSRLADGHDARLIIKKSDNASSAIDGLSGTVYFGPYEPVLKAIITTAPESYNVTTRTEQYGTDVYAARLHWSSEGAEINGDEETQSIRAVKYFSPADFSSYKGISLDFALNKAVPFTLILDNELPAATALKLEIKDSQILQTMANGFFHTLKVDLKSNQVYIDNLALPASTYALYINNKVIPSRQKILVKIPQGLQSQGNFYIGKLTYDDSEIYGNLQNYITASYKKEGTIIDVKGFPLIKDFSAAASSLQSSGKLHSPELTITSDLEAGATLSGIQTMGQLSFKQEKISLASHSLKTDSSIIPFISAQEKYDYDINSKEIRKEDNFEINLSKINVPLVTSVKTLVQDNIQLGKQKAEFEISYNQPIGNYSAGISSKLNLSQKINNAFCISQNSTVENYFYDWARISGEQFSTGRKDAVNRVSDFSTKIDGIIPIKETVFKPQLEYGLNGAYKKSEKTLFTDTESLSLLLPFSLNNWAAGFEIARKGGETKTLSSFNSLYTDGSYTADLQNTLALQNEHQWFYTSVPFYELFDVKLADKIKGDYSARYEIKYSRSLSNSLKDLFIPSSALFSVVRDIKNQNEKNADLYQIKCVLTNTSINNFGSNSVRKVFNFFQQEEIFSTLTGTIKIPVKEGSISGDIKYQLSAYLQILLLIKEKTTFTSTMDFSIDNSLNWNTRGTFVYERPSSSCLYSLAIKYLFPQLLKVDYTIKRKDSLNIEFEKTSEEFIQKYGYSHYAEMMFQNHYAITGEIGGLYTGRQKTASRFTLNLSIGAKAEF